jgi:penicillin-binding protein 1A
MLRALRAAGAFSPRMGQTMDLILVKIFATALALSEVMTQPQAGKTHFDPMADQDQVVQTLRTGCAHMRRAFDIESINLDDLITTALNDQKAVGTDIKAFHGINFADLNVAYHRFCKNENVGNSVVDLGQVIEFFNDAAADLPDHTRLKGRKLPSMSAILDGKGANFADVFEPSNRRIWVSLDDIPDSVQKAFVAAEDRRLDDPKGDSDSKPRRDALGSARRAEPRGCNAGSKLGGYGRKQISVQAPRSMVTLILIRRSSDCSLGSSASREQDRKRPFRRNRS